MIRVVSLCVFRDGDRILISEGIDRATGRRFARPLGGGVEVGETSRQAIAREIREEIGLDTSGLQLLGVLENLFELEGKPGHEIVFVYDGRFSDRSVYDCEQITMNEAGWESPARWQSIHDFADGCQLVPAGLLGLLLKTNHT